MQTFFMNIRFAVCDLSEYVFMCVYSYPCRCMYVFVHLCMNVCVCVYRSHGGMYQ
jgi:hypothetical protein